MLYYRFNKTEISIIENKSTARKTPIEYELYEDALKRRKSRDERNHVKNSTSINKFSSNTSEKYAITRTTKDIKYIWDYI